MQNKRFYAVLVLAAGIVLAALLVADLLQWMDASTGFALQGSVWARYLPWLAALALPYLPARRVAAQPTELTDTNLPLGCCMLMTGALLLGSGLLSVSSAQTISAYPELYATTPAWTAWADVITPVLAGAWLLVYGWRALTGVGVRRPKLGGALPGHTLFAAGAGCFLLCTCIELPQTLFEAFNGMLTMPDLLTGLAMGVFGLCGLACTWAAAGEETE